MDPVPAVRLLTHLPARVEIIMQRVKRLSPEEIAMRIIQCDQEVCDEHFLRELVHVLPSPEQVSSFASLLSRL